MTTASGERIKEYGFATEAEAKAAREALVERYGDHHSLNEVEAERSAQRRGDPELQAKVEHLRACLEVGWWEEGYFLGYDEV